MALKTFILRLALVLLAIGLLFGGCAGRPDLVAETPVQILRMTRPANISTSEFSGLAWYGDWLVMLPQYPHRFWRQAGSPDGGLFILEKAEILAYLDSEDPDRLDPRFIPLDAGDLRHKIKGFEGFESIAFHGGSAYLTIEVEQRRIMRAYIVRGEMAPDLAELTLDLTTLTEIPLPQNMSNLTDEAVLIQNDEVLTFFEANGRNLVARPSVQRFDLDLNHLGSISLDNIEFRVTDVTPPDEQGRFWALNYFFAADLPLWSLNDPLAHKYGGGIGSNGSLAVERIVQFEVTPTVLRQTGDPPILLARDGLLGRNWEGIVRLDERGFLIVSDRFPDSLLGFVPFPNP